MPNAAVHYYLFTYQILQGVRMRSVIDMTVQKLIGVAYHAR